VKEAWNATEKYWDRAGRYNVNNPDCREFFANKFATELHKRWKDEHIADAGKMVPIAGPPSLDGVPDNALFVVPYNDSTPMVPELNCQQAASIKRYWDDYKDCKWHILLGVIEPPEPELPKCPWCKGEMIPYERDLAAWTVRCSKITCKADGPFATTKAEAIKAARKVSVGRSIVEERG
jgi:hypothetical protein